MGDLFIFSLFALLNLHYFFNLESVLVLLLAFLIRNEFELDWRILLIYQDCFLFFVLLFYVQKVKRILWLCFRFTYLNCWNFFLLLFKNFKKIVIVRILLWLWLNFDYFHLFLVDYFFLFFLFFLSLSLFLQFNFLLFLFLLLFLLFCFNLFHFLFLFQLLFLFFLEFA
jgi:hypothetical protein